MDSLDFYAPNSCPVFPRVVLFGDLGRSLRKKASNDMAFPHPQSRKDHYRNEHKPSRAGVVWNLVKRTINVTDYRNAKDNVNPAKNPTFCGLVHDWSVLLLSGHRIHLLWYSGLPFESWRQSFRAKGPAPRPQKNPATRHARFRPLASSGTRGVAF